MDVKIRWSMSDRSKLSEKRSAFAEAAARLEQVQRAVKQQQQSESRRLLPQPVRTPPISPDEMWSRNFMTQAIGPSLESVSVAKLPEPPPNVPNPLLRTEVFTTPDILQKGSPATVVPMRQQLGGREVRRRGWFARLLFGA